MVSEAEEDAEEGHGQHQFRQFVSDGGDLERLAEEIRENHRRRMIHSRDSGDDDERLQPSAQDPELWMLRTKVGES